MKHKKHVGTDGLRLTIGEDGRMDLKIPPPLVHGQYMDLVEARARHALNNACAKDANLVGAVVLLKKAKGMQPSLPASGPAGDIDLEARLSTLMTAIYDKAGLLGEVTLVFKDGASLRQAQDGDINSLTEPFTKNKFKVLGILPADDVEDYMAYCREEEQEMDVRYLSAEKK